jgi:hypothetical protein
MARPWPIVSVALLLGAVSVGGCRSVKCGPGTRLEKGLCVCEGGGAAAAAAVPASGPAEAEAPSDAKPDEQRLKSMARRLLARSEDARVFTIKSVSIANTMTEGNTLTAKVQYVVTASRIGQGMMSFDVLMGGPQHILPIGTIHRGKSYSGGFTMVLKKYDKGWDVHSYQRN